MGGWASPTGKREGEPKPFPPGQAPQTPGPPPWTQPHYGVPAIGRGAGAPADDLVDAFLVDGGVAFLRRRRPRRGMGRHREGQSL